MVESLKRSAVGRGRAMRLKVALPLALLMTWCLLTYGGIVRGLFLPSPTDVARQIIDLSRDGVLLPNVAQSLLRVSVGFAISVAFAVPLGLWMGHSPAANAAFEPTIAFVRYMPATALIPLSILWLGVGFLQSIALVFMSVFFYLTLMVADIVRSLSRELLETALTLGATRRQVMTRVVVPACLPHVWDAMRTMWGVGWTMLVVVELVGTATGIGAMIIRAQRFLQTPDVFAGVAVVGSIGVLSDSCFRILRPVFFPWAAAQTKNS
ncbi:MAG: ABC transporter permease [Vicinamibacteria bacterium]|nr:ABC transporter permease [Vicinamibacteria bacterium]